MVTSEFLPVAHDDGGNLHPSGSPLRIQPAPAVEIVILQILAVIEGMCTNAANTLPSIWGLIPHQAGSTIRGNLNRPGDIP